MTALLWILHATFWTPFVVRYVRTGLAPTPDDAPDTRRESLGLVVHTAALAIVYAQLVAATLGSPDAFAGPLAVGAGAVLIGVAAVLTTWTLARFRSWRARAALARDHSLCTRGPFRLVRQAIYAALGLLSIGSCCFVPTPWTLGATLVGVIAADRRARIEEELLQTACGPTYDANARRVRRFVPWIY